jgi:hypothetical protein
MRLLLIGCEVILRELCWAVVRSPHLVDVRFLGKGLHDLGARAMREGIQQAIDAHDHGPHDAVVLGYGLCGNGLAGVTARSKPLVLPRAHDCITLLMGSRQRFEAYFREHTGVYYRSSGWVERGGDLEPLARNKTGAGFTLDALVEKYGEDNGRYLYDELTRYRSTYKQLTYLRTPADPGTQFQAQAEREAQRKGWAFEAIEGDLGLFERLLAGQWDEPDFLVVAPGQSIAAATGAPIVTAIGGAT